MSVYNLIATFFYFYTFFMILSNFILFFTILIMREEKKVMKRKCKYVWSPPPSLVPPHIHVCRRVAERNPDVAAMQW